MKIKNIKYCTTILFTTLSISLVGCASPKVEAGHQLSEITMIDGTEFSTNDELTFPKVPNRIQQEVNIESIVRNTKNQISYIQGIKQGLGELTKIEDIKIYQNKNQHSYQIEMMTDSELYISKTKDQLESLTDHLDYLKYTCCDTVRLANCDSIEAVSSIPNKEAIKYMLIFNSPDEDLSPLVAFPNLEKLKIVNCPNIKDIQAVGSLSQLSSLSIIGTNVSNIEPLSKLEQLLYLDLRGNRLTEESIKTLESMLSLKNISLYYNNIHDPEALNSLVETESIKQLVTATSDRNDVMILPKSNMEKDSFSTLSVTKLDNTDKYLVVLNEENEEVGAFGILDSIETGYFLEYQYDNIYLMNCDNCDLLKRIKHPEAVEKIIFEYCDFEQLENVQRFSNLKRLIVTGNPSLSDISDLSGMEQMISVRIENTNVEDITVLSSLPELRYLIIPSNQIKDATTLLEIPNLEYVSVSYNYISDLEPLEKLEGRIVDTRDKTQLQAKGSIPQKTIKSN